MLADLLDCGGKVRLFADSGIQFIDCGFSKESKILSSLVCFFRARDGRRGGRGAIEVTDITASALVGERGPAFHCRIAAAEAVRYFDGVWLPVPFFRRRNGGFDDGPTNWCRVWSGALDRPDPEGNTHRVVLAFDTALASPIPAETGTAPSEQDVGAGYSFELMAEPSGAAGFASLDWVESWLRTIDIEKKGTAKGKATGDDWQTVAFRRARYLTLLAVLDQLKIVPQVGLIASAGQGRVVLDVDLVLDVGNARTCGLLSIAGESGIERLSDKTSRLTIRDLSRPCQADNMPFPSQIEFARAAFGPEAASRRSGRFGAFSWPSVARVGAEAVALAWSVTDIEGRTGLSSPKRYLWDDASASMQWRHAVGGGSGERDASTVIVGDLLQALRNDGGEKGDTDPGVDEAWFSRGSMMMFFLIEILLQAQVQINAPAERAHLGEADRPRRLRQVVITVPTAMAPSERALYQTRADAAVRVLWRSLGPTLFPEARIPPSVVMVWDEAMATQIAFLYNEFIRNFLSDSKTLFDVLGRRRDDGAPPSLRIASIDIGGGTTDLSIATFSRDGVQGLRLTRDFREGIGIAGDDIVARVIEAVVLPAISAAIGARTVGSGPSRSWMEMLTFATGEARTVGSPHEVLDGVIGDGSRALGHGEQIRRRQIATQVFAPAALAILTAFEQSGGDSEADISVALAPYVQAADPKAVAFFEGKVRQAGGDGFDLSEVTVAARGRAVDQAIRQAVGGVLTDLCEVVHACECDILLLSGMSSRLPTVQAQVVSMVPVPRDRILPMKDYAVGSWYPYRTAGLRILDPKTTSVVGALVCVLAGGELPGFRLCHDEDGGKDAVRFIGVMDDVHPRIDDTGLIFAPHESSRGASATVMARLPLDIGFRQLPLPRWPASLLYRVEGESSGPLVLRLARKSPPAPPDALEIVEVLSPDGRPCQDGGVVLRFKTTRQVLGYWTDTGLFRVAVS